MITPSPQGRLRTCPVCKAAGFHRQTHPRGYWEAQVFSRLGLRPFRCSQCRSRFLRFGRSGDLPPLEPRERKRRKAVETQDFLPSEDDRNFEELIRDIRTAEKKRGLTGPDQLPPPSDQR